MKKNYIQRFSRGKKTPEDPPTKKISSSDITEDIVKMAEDGSWEGNIPTDLKDDETNDGVRESLKDSAERFNTNHSFELVPLVGDSDKTFVAESTDTSGYYDKALLDSLAEKQKEADAFSAKRSELVKQVKALISDWIGSGKIFDDQDTAYLAALTKANKLASDRDYDESLNEGLGNLLEYVNPSNNFWLYLVCGFKDVANDLKAYDILGLNKNDNFKFNAYGKWYHFNPNGKFKDKVYPWVKDNGGFINDDSDIIRKMIMAKLGLNESVNTTNGVRGTYILTDDNMNTYYVPVKYYNEEPFANPFLMIVVGPDGTIDYSYDANGAESPNIGLYVIDSKTGKSIEPIIEVADSTTSDESNIDPNKIITDSTEYDTGQTDSTEYDTGQTEAADTSNYTSGDPSVGVEEDGSIDESVGDPRFFNKKRGGRLNYRKHGGRLIRKNMSIIEEFKNEYYG